MCQQHLGGMDLVLLETGLKLLDQAHLTERGRRLQFVQCVRARVMPMRAMPSATAPDDTSISSLPAARSCDICSAQRWIATVSRPCLRW